MIGRRFLIAGFFLLGLFAGLPAGAADSLPSRVGRVSAIDGTAAVRPVGGEWADSGINHPVVAGMSVRTPPQGRAVLRIGAEMIALAGATELDLARLDSGSTQIVLRRGRIGVRLSHLDPARSIEIDIPRGGIWLLTSGGYDITAGDERAPARIAVFDGRAHFVGKGLETAIATGSANVLSGNDPVVASLDGAVADGFAAWWRPPNTDGAGRADAESQALRYFSAEMTGYEALDGNGSWETVGGYGAVWFPTTAPDDWAPYRYGNWRWIAPWGWSWIDDMAWGFAPSHYGRWARVPQSDQLDPSGPGTARWGWVPGRLVADPVYAPALVAFLGTAGVGLSHPDAKGPAVAWFPLAPGEVYWPRYTGDLDAIRAINQGAVADVAAIGPGMNGEPPAEIVTGAYQNRRFASVVPRSVFTGGRPVAPALLQLPEQRLDNAPLLAGSPQIAPAAPRAATVATSAAPRSARATGALARILPQQGRASAVRPTILVRPVSARAAAAALSGPSRWPNARQAQTRLIAAMASRTLHPRLRLAAAHRTTAR